MSVIPTTRAVRLIPILEGLRELSHPVERELRAANLPSGCDSDPTALIPLYQFWRFAENASLRTGCLALLAQSIERTSLENLVASRLVLRSPTLRHVLKSFCRYSAMEARFSWFWMEPGENEAWFRYSVRDVEESRCNVFLQIGALARMQRIVRALIPSWRPARIFVRSPAIGDLASELELLGWSNVRFAAGFTGFPIPDAMLDLTSGPDRRDVCTQEDIDPAAAAQTRMPRTFSESLRCLMTSYRQDQWLSIERAAELAEVSQRTLQLRLAEEGLTFREICDECRMQVAVKFLRTSDTPLDVVAREVGYADRSVFSRAFHRWAGVNPSDFRRNLKSHP